MKSGEAVPPASDLLGPSEMSHPASGLQGHVRRRRDPLLLAVGALGVVYGDIGTSPLYALRECVSLPHGVAPGHENILGVLSLVFWSITFVISIKYLLFVMRADNGGEGGVLSLLVLATRPQPNGEQRVPRRAPYLILLGLCGASLLLGEGIITPAISVLSAVEGLSVATTAFSPFVVPLTCAILVALFAFQKRGTAGIGAVFGPVTLCWFVAIAAAGLPWIVRHPAVLAAINPIHAVRFFVDNGWHGFLVLGSVVLCITGCEALYADMGHFGRPAIRTAWYACVFPALLINYFGQGALVLVHPEAAANPFYGLVPASLLYPMVMLATMATVVASQALISGAFSLARQAVQLGYLPRVSIIHTSGKTEGQIYVPEINNILMVSCLVLVIGFQTSASLAAAYGIAVTGTMSITSTLLYFVARTRWNWSRWRAGTLLGMFWVFDLSFFATCFAKIKHGGWFPLIIASSVFTIMVTWKKGRKLLAERLAVAMLPLEDFIEDVERVKPPRVAGTAVFLASTRRGTPPVMLHHFKHNKCLHRQVVILSIVTDAVPEVAAENVVQLKAFAHGFWAITAHYGFMQTPDVLKILGACEAHGLHLDQADISFYLGRETLLLDSRDHNMALWRKRLFRYLSRNARPATDFFAIPPNRVVEIGAQIEL